MSVTDLIILAGGLKEDAQKIGIEVSRVDTAVVGIYRKVIKVDLPEEYWNTSEEQGFLLKDKDIVFVPTNPRYSTKKLYRFPGMLSIPVPTLYAMKGRNSPNCSGVRAVFGKGHTSADLFSCGRRGMRPYFLRISLLILWE